jgi:hypothetical protein
VYGLSRLRIAYQPIFPRIRNRYLDHLGTWSEVTTNLNPIGRLPDGAKLPTVQPHFGNVSDIA